jgi:hypothetical protein
MMETIKTLIADTEVSSEKREERKRQPKSGPDCDPQLDMA